MVAIINQFIGIVVSIMQVLLSVALSFGIVTPPANDQPIVFKDSENVKMSAVIYADTHTRNTAFNPYFLECGFEDINNSEEEFDAFVIAGDITEMGDEGSYQIIWDAIAEADCFDTVLLATGNHDIRFTYEYNTDMIMSKQSEYIGQEIDKPYYSYDVNGYTFIVLGSDAWQFEKAIISDEQLAFLDSELARATKDGKPAFVVCHQPLANTHGLPEVWQNGDLGADSEEVKAILMKYENVFFLNGHLHDGVYEKSLEVFDAEKGVYSINLPAYGKDNDYGPFSQTGLGVYVEVYDDEVVFTARDFQAGKALEGYSRSFDIK